MRIGVDVGGTYTDLVLLSEQGFSTHKVPSTPDNPARAVLDGVAELSVPLSDVSLFAHGTTVTTNAVIQRKGTPTGLLTTKGFRDVLQIRRTTRGKLYDFQWDPPAELVPRELRREVRERTLASGAIAVEPDVDGALAEVESLLSAGVRSLAICFINSYIEPSNELRIRDAVRAAFPSLPVYASSELLREWREFERTSTTVVSAYVGPVLSEYIDWLAEKLAGGGYAYDLMVMSSNGGLSTANAVVAAPAQTLASGPAAGVTAQLALLRVAGIENAIGMDIGGTSTDISIIHGGRPQLRSEFELEFGTTVSYPVIDINSIGAGGGTIAWVDRGGMLHVGPESAGASPGPVCLERGGVEPTITDANVVLHRLNPRSLLGGRIAISEAAAEAALARVGEPLGLDAERFAEGVLTLAVSNIAFAIRQLTVERGLDPREFALVAYGGAGPLLAAVVADELEVPRVLVPRFPGLTSALGLLYTDVRHDFVSTYLRPAADMASGELAEGFAALAAQGRARLAGEGIPPERMEFIPSADLRYLGQTHELNVVLPADPSVAQAGLAQLLHEAHLKEFGHAPDENTPLEVVNIRLACLGLLDQPQLPLLETAPTPAPIGRREVVFSGERLTTPILEREQLGRGFRTEGPAIVEQADSTTVVPPGWRAEVDRYGNLLLERV
jgi:N-methylhydantoinase A